MKRSLKVVSRRQQMVGAKRRMQVEEPTRGDVLSEQEIAQIGKKQSTLTALNELARTVSHHLNSPLTVLLGRVELLSKINENGGASQEEVRKFVEACKREICRIDAIVKAFHDIGRVQHKTYPPGVKMLDVEREINSRMKDTCFLR